MKRNRKALTGMSGLAVALLIGASASGATLGGSGVVNNSYNAAGFQSGIGGEFYVQTTANNPGGVNNSAYAGTTRNQAGISDSFQTFCLERSENLGHMGIRYIINDRAVLGGANSHGGSGGDPLSVGTAWLYSQFAQGILGVASAATGDNYAFGGPQAARKTSAGLLQDAIWMLEDELAVASNPFLTLLTTSVGLGGAGFASVAAAQANYATGDYGVYVLNMQSLGGAKRQDMLWFEAAPSLVPDGGATVMLLGLALGGISLFARRKNLSKTV